MNGTNFPEIGIKIFDEFDNLVLSPKDLELMIPTTLQVYIHILLALLLCLTKVLHFYFILVYIHRLEFFLMQLTVKGKISSIIRIRTKNGETSWPSCDSLVRGNWYSNCILFIILDQLLD